MNVNVSSNSQVNTDPLGAPASEPSSSKSSSSNNGFVADYEALYTSAFTSLEKMLQGVLGNLSKIDSAPDASAQGTQAAAPTQPAAPGMTAQSAAGALAAYMHEHNIQTVNPDQLYQMAYKPAAGTPPEVSQAAKFMLQNPDVYNQIETHDVPGSDGIAGVNDFDWAAQGGLSASAGAQAGASAGGEAAFAAGIAGIAGALAAFMREHSVADMTPNKLYQLAFNPPAGTPSTVSKAAKSLLGNPDAYNKLETHDVKGSDGIAGVNDFDWAAEGGMSASAGAHTGTSASAGTQSKSASTQSSSDGGDSGAAGAIAAYMHEHSIADTTPDTLYKLAFNPAEGTPPAVSQAAKFMLANPDAYNRLETHDVKGSDGIAGVNDFDWAAQGGLDKK
jgi:hypothetical protein